MSAARKVLLTAVFLLLLVPAMAALVMAAPKQSEPGPKESRVGAKPKASGAESKKGQSGEMWKLSFQGQMFGPANVYMSSNGILIKMRVGNILFQSAHPDAANHINPENKTYLTVSANEMVRDIGGRNRSMRIDRFEVADKTENGFPAKVYTCYAGRPTEEKSAEITCLSNTNLPPSVQTMWRRMFGIEGRDWGVPVRFIRTGQQHWRNRRFGGEHRHHANNNAAHKGDSDRPHGHWNPQQLTVESIEKIPMETELFVVPNGFTKAKDRAALYFSSDGDAKSKDVEEFFRVKMK